MRKRLIGLIAASDERSGVSGGLFAENNLVYALAKFLIRRKGFAANGDNRHCIHLSVGQNYLSVIVRYLGCYFASQIAKMVAFLRFQISLPVDPDKTPFAPPSFCRRYQ
jgi:hypothetical protein